MSKKLKRPKKSAKMPALPVPELLQYQLVRFLGPWTEDYPEDFKHTMMFLGEIPMMPVHCAVVGKSGKTYFGYHTDDLVALTEDEI